MDIKNILSGFSSRAKMIAGAVLVCLAAISIMVFDFNNKNADENIAHAYGYAVTNDACSSAGTYACASDQNSTLLICSKEAHRWQVYGAPGTAAASCSGSSSVSSSVNSEGVTGASAAGCSSGYYLSNGVCTEILSVTETSNTSCKPNEKRCSLDDFLQTCNGSGTGWDKGQFFNGCSGGAPVSGATVATSGTGSNGFFNCSGITAGNECGNPNSDDACGWSGASQKHCYCVNKSGTNGYVWKFDNDMAAYCDKCADRESESGVCTCKYTKYGLTTENSLDTQTKTCDLSGTPLENYEIACKNPSGTATKNAADENACLNSKCVEGTGCGSVDKGCEQMNNEIMALISYRENGKVDASGQNLLTEKDADFAMVRDLLAKIGNYGLSVQQILSHAAVAEVAGTNDIACASVNAKTCGAERGGQEYKCVGVGGSKSGSGCYVWSWAVSGASKDCAGLGCEYTANNQNLGKCKTNVSPDVLDQCTGSDGQIYKSGGNKCGLCDGVAYGYCRCYGNNDWRFEAKCSKDECDAKTGCSALAVKEQCKAGTYPCDTNSECADCGNDYECKISSTGSSKSSFTSTYNDEDYTASGKKGVCQLKSDGGNTGECSFTVDAGTPSSSNSKCKTGSSYGVYVPFTVDTEGECSGISCKVTNDYDNTSVTGTQSSGSNWYACAKPQSSSSSSDGTKGDNPSKLNFKISCTDGKKTSEDTASCPFPTADDNKFKQAEEEEQASTTEDKANEAEQEKQDSTAPKVTVNKPGANETISAKTAELSVTTDINATCKYMDSKNGSFTSSNFDGSGMSMNGSGGTTHTATLNNLTEGTASDCKYNHTIVVLCKNSKASSDSSKTTAAIGSGQTSFVVDLSKNTENAPKVVNATDGKYAIANPVLKVTTDRPADCEYKEGSSFTFSSGKKFDSTGSYNHSAQLSGLTDKDYDYYVVCKDKETCAQNTAVEVKFTVALPGNASTTLAIVSTTPENQTVANPTLSVSTDLPANCQYKKDSTFIYGDSSAKQFTNDADYSHTAALPAAEYPDGKYTFYVACKAKDSGASKTLGQAIITTLKRSGDVAGAPVISNTTPNSQTTGTPTLSITTSAAATCQYNEGGEFTYGSGIQFTTDGGTGHSVQLADVSDGQHTFYVACKDTATNAVNSAATQIIFTVTTAQTCANLETNDKQNDNDRDVADEDDATDSDYLWRSMEAGTRDKFTKVDWYAGYQFTPEKDGQVTQLCGYFGDGNSNRVSLYSGSYAELASVQISGTGGWKCASISPVPVKTDKRYYVITRVQDGPIYYEYKSGLLPRDNDNATVESGIRQLAGEKFGSNVKKYDYMVFGLVDARIKFEAENTDGPEVDTAIPVGTISDNNTVISVATNINATCKYDRDDVDYNDMKYTFAKTGAKVHEQKVCNLDDGPFTFYVRCKGTTGTNNASTLIQFEVSD